MARKITGIDITPFAVRTVELERGLRDTQIVSVSEIKLTPDNTTAAEALEKLFNVPPPRDSLIVGIDGLGLASRILSFPFSNRKKIAQVAPFELESEAPFSASDLVINHQVLHVGPTSTKVVVTGIKRERLEKTLEELSEAGIEPRALVPTNGVLANVAGFLYPPDGQHKIFLDIGHSSTNLVAVGPEGVEALRSLPKGMMHIIGKIQSTTGLLKVEDCLDAIRSNSIEVVGAFERAFTEVLTPDLTRTLHSFRTKNGIEPEKIIISGDLPATAQVLEYISSSLAVENVELLKLPKVHFPGEPEANAGFGRALGLALSDVTGKYSVNLRAGEYAFQTRFEVARERLVLPITLVVLIFFAVLANAAISTRALKMEAVKLDQQIATTFINGVPELKHVPGREITDLQKRLTELKNLSLAARELTGPTPMLITSAISKSIDKDIDVDLDEILFDRDIIKIVGTVSVYSDLDKISSALLKNDEFVKVDAPETKETIDGRTRFTFKIFTRSSEEQDKKKNGK